MVVPLAESISSGGQAVFSILEEVMNQPLSSLARWVVAGVLAGFEMAALAVQWDYPGATDTSLNGINNSGQIVGEFRDASGSHGFVYDRGTFTTLDVPGSSFTAANAIN